jgi:hypothetical protein
MILKQAYSFYYAQMQHSQFTKRLNVSLYYLIRYKLFYISGFQLIVIKFQSIILKLKTIKSPRS